MRLLVDTHILLWTLDKPARLSDQLRATLQDDQNEVCFSAVSIWEIAIKSRLGRADFRHSPTVIAHEARETGFLELSIGAHAAAQVAELPLHHRDPFDRLLVAQAITERVHLYTADRRLRSYSDLVVLVG